MKMPKHTGKIIGLILSCVLYCAALLYVQSTPTQVDDAALEAAKGVIVDYFAEAEGKPDPSSDYDAAGFKYGEGE